MCAKTSNSYEGSLVHCSSCAGLDARHGWLSWPTFQTSLVLFVMSAATSNIDDGVGDYISHSQPAARNRMMQREVSVVAIMKLPTDGRTASPTDRSARGSRRHRRRSDRWIECLNVVLISNRFFYPFFFYIYMIRFSILSSSLFYPLSLLFWLKSLFGLPFNSTLSTMSRNWKWFFPLWIILILKETDIWFSFYSCKLCTLETAFNSNNKNYCRLWKKKAGRKQKPIIVKNQNRIGSLGRVGGPRD